MKVLICGGGILGKTAQTKLLAENVGAELITTEEAKGRGISITQTVKPDTDMLFEITELPFTPPPTRQDKRKAKRNKNKLKK